MGKAGVEEWNRKIPRIATFVAGLGIGRETDQATLRAEVGEERLCRRPDTGETVGLFLDAQVAHDGNAVRGVRNGQRGLLAVVGNQSGRTRAEPDGDGAFRVEQEHGSGPVGSAGMAPEAPRDGGEFRMSGTRAEIGEGLLEALVGAVSRIAPEGAAVRFLLVIGRPEQRTAPLPCERLPMQVVGRGLASAASALPATVLVDDDAAQLGDTGRKPERVGRAEREFAGVRRAGIRDLGVGRVERGGRGSSGGEECHQRLGEDLFTVFVGVDGIAIEEMGMELRRLDVVGPRRGHVDVGAAFLGGELPQRFAIGSGAGVRRLGQRVGVAGVDGSKGSGAKEDLHLGQTFAELMDDFADAGDVLLADAADEDEVWSARQDVLPDPVLLLVMLATAAAADVDGGLDVGPGIRLGQFRDPAGAHGVVDDAVAQGEQTERAALGEDAAGAAELRPVVRRCAETPGRHPGLDHGDLPRSNTPTLSPA